MKWKYCKIHSNKFKRCIFSIFAANDFLNVRLDFFYGICQTYFERTFLNKKSFFNVFLNCVARDRFLLNLNVTFPNSWSLRYFKVYD